jgi:predicted TIM-barrel fold metal-dependent hydrolase
VNPDNQPVKEDPPAMVIDAHIHLGDILYPDVMEMLGGFRNVWVDISIQSPGRIRKLVAAFGPNRVLNASDCPWGRMNTSIRAVKRACRGDRSLERRILHENAAELMKR